METPYFKRLHQEVMRNGGLFNAHLHLCRAGTLEETERLLAGEGSGDHSHLSISKKHGLIPLIHASKDYDPENLSRRVNYFLDLMEKAGTTHVHTLVDVTTDRLGASVLEAFLRFKTERHNKLDLQVGAYTPLGFTDAEPERWHLIEKSAAIADFIGGLPERDDRGLYPDHIGYVESCRRTLLLANKLNKQIHIHVDQKNDPSERGTKIIMSVIDELGLSYAPGEPKVWLVHVISPSTYEDAEFNDIASELSEKNIGVICCPSAAISMRQLRPNRTPTYNSIARVLELLAAGVHVRIGSDNINDITSPGGTADLMDELFVLSNTIRFYDIPILAKIGAGLPMSKIDRQKISAHLELNTSEVARAIANAKIVAG